MAAPKPPPKLRKDGQPKRSGRPPKDPTKDVQSRAVIQTPSQQPSEDDDLLGFGSVAGFESSDDDELGEVDDNVFAGVTRTWLARVFRMADVTVKKRLANCPIKGRRGTMPKYDLFTAAQYLVPPRVDVSEFIKGMRPNDLPPILQAAFWDAQKKRQDYEINAGDLWHTDKVISVLSETFKLIKTSVMLWTDTLEQEHGLTEKQREALQALCDGLMDDIHRSLVKQHETSRTTNQLADVAMLEQSMQIGPGSKDE